MKVVIKSIGKTEREIENDLLKLSKSIENDLDKLMNDTITYMISVIINNKKRPGGDKNLEKNITLEKGGNGNIVSWGIGNIDLLNQKAPYWHFVNYGVSLTGMTIPGRGKCVPFGSFIPGEPKPSKDSFQQGRWVIGGKYTFRAKQGIVNPLHYIELSRTFLNSKLDGMIKGV